MSASRLSGLFLAATGQSPRAWLEQARLQHARSLLATTGLPVKLVAAACGYTDPRHFATRFRRHFGATPGQCRARDVGHAAPGGLVLVFAHKYPSRVTRWQKRAGLRPWSRRKTRLYC